MGDLKIIQDIVISKPFLGTITIFYPTKMAETVSFLGYRDFQKPSAHLLTWSVAPKDVAVPVRDNASLENMRSQLAEESKSRSEDGNGEIASFRNNFVCQAPKVSETDQTDCDWDCFILQCFLTIHCTSILLSCWRQLKISKLPKKKQRWPPRKLKEQRSKLQKWHGCSMLLPCWVMYTVYTTWTNHMSLVWTCLTGNTM